MATTRVSNKDPTDDLTRELQRLFEAITEELSSSSDNEKEFTENVDRAIQTLLTLKDLKKERKQQSSSSIEPVSVYPRDVNYPLLTYDRSPIQKWLKETKLFSITQQLLSNPISEIHPSPDRPPLLPSLFNALASSNLYEQKQSAKALRLLTKRISLTETETKEFIPQLLTPLTETKIDPDLHRDLIKTLKNLSIHEPNKKIVSENLSVVPILLSALQSKTVKTKRNVAASLSALSALNANKSLIGKAGSLKPLIDVLEDGNMKDTASAIYNLCFDEENKERVVQNGAVRVVLKKVEERVVFVDELLGILAVLFDHPKAVAEMREKEGRYRTISKIAETGSLMAKWKANGILDRIGIGRSHTR